MSSAWLSLAAFSAPSMMSIIAAINMPGTTFTTTTVRQLYQVSSAPITNGASASPKLPNMPCTDSTKPLRSG